MKWVRAIGGVAFGCVVGVVVMMGIGTIGQRLFPPKLELDLTNIAELKRIALHRIPLGAQLFMLLSWAIGSFMGGWAAARLAGHSHVAVAVATGAVLMAMRGWTMTNMSYPAWMAVVGLALFLPCAWAGGSFRAAGAAPAAPPASGGGAAA